MLIFSGACHREELPRTANGENAASASQASQEDLPPPTTDVAVADPRLAKRLLRGFFNGTPQWRWTDQTFAVSVDPPEPPQKTFVTLDFTVPQELIQEVQTVTLTAKVNGVEVGKDVYRKEGRQYFRREVSPKALTRKPAEVEFSIDKMAKGTEGHPIGLIVVGVGLDPSDDAVIDHDMQVRMARAGYRELLEQRRHDISPEKQNEFMRLFHDIPIWKNMWFQNVPIEKNPLDLWMMQQIIYEVQPDFIVETGTFRGGSALYWSHTLNGMGLDKSRVITVDIQDLTGNAAQHPLWKKYVTFFKGSSTDPKIVAEIAQRVQGHKVLVTLDSDHSMQHVLNELHAYAPMVTQRSYLIVEDTHIDGVPTQPDAGPGPLAALRKFLSEGGNKQFTQDFSREAFIMTFNPGGWLRRK